MVERALLIKAANLQTISSAPDEVIPTGFFTRQL